MLLDLEIFSTQELLEMDLKSNSNKTGDHMLYTGIITHIGHLEPTRKGGRFYRRIQFRLDHGMGWAKTDVVQGFRNSVRWEQGIDLGIGTICKNLELSGSKTVNADSNVIFKKVG